MERIPLEVFVSEQGQEKTAGLLGIFQSAVSKAISSGRNITILISDDGEITAEETRPFPSKKRGLKAA